MRHDTLSLSTAGSPVIYPWQYVGMRRRAAGLTIDQLAARLGGRVHVRHLRALERPGLRFVDIADLGSVISFSAAVYRQLADLPAHQHPRLCSDCGWDAHTDQPDRHDGLTTWSEHAPDRCTRCEQTNAA